MLTRLRRMDELKLTEKVIFRSIHRSGAVSKKDLVSLLGGSVTTVSRFLAAMEEAGLVMRDGEDRRPGGRRPDIYRVRPDAMYAFGGFITREGYGIGLSDAVGNVLAYDVAPLTRTTEPAAVAEYFDRTIERILSDTDIDRNRVLGIGLGVMGPVRKQKGLMFHPYHIESELWDIVPIRDIVELKTGMPTIVDSLAETMLIDEIVYGHAKGAESAAFIWADRGIGCATFTKGILGMGNADLSSSVGHLVVDFKGEPCECGKRGCLETYGSIESLIRRFGSADEELKRRIDSLSAEPENLDFWDHSAPLEEIRRSLDAGRIAAELVDEIVLAFVYGVANFLSIARPQIILYGGRTVNELPSLMDDVRERIRGLHRDDGIADTKSYYCEVGNEMVIRGASLLFLNTHVGFVNTGIRREQEVKA